MLPLLRPPVREGTAQRQSRAAAVVAAALHSCSSLLRSGQVPGPAQVRTPGWEADSLRGHDRSGWSTGTAPVPVREPAQRRSSLLVVAAGTVRARTWAVAGGTGHACGLAVVAALETAVGAPSMEQTRARVAAAAAGNPKHHDDQTARMQARTFPLRRQHVRRDLPSPRALY